VTSERLFVALDVSSAHDALKLVDALGDAVTQYKIGLELFIAEGPRVVEAVRARGKQVFLDLKLHDIPETVARAAQSAERLGVGWLTVHASGGVAMMKRAVEAAPRVRVLGVTVLTSLEVAELRADGIDAPSTEAQVLRRAALAAEAGCAGVIASPLEVAAIRRAHPFLIVTPGVRMAAASDDQKRVATAREARAAGADAVVVGRPIRDAADPRAAAQRILDELR
jgi:orotidine-5'-phosphate decarboxylase